MHQFPFDEPTGSQIQIQIQSPGSPSPVPSFPEVDPIAPGNRPPPPSPQPPGVFEGQQAVHVHSEPVEQFYTPPESSPLSGPQFQERARLGASTFFSRGLAMAYPSGSISSTLRSQQGEPPFPPDPRLPLRRQPESLNDFVNLLRGYPEAAAGQAQEARRRARRREHVDIEREPLHVQLRNRQWHQRKTDKEKRQQQEQQQQDRPELQTQDPQASPRPHSSQSEGVLATQP